MNQEEFEALMGMEDQVKDIDLGSSRDPWIAVDSVRVEGRKVWNEFTPEQLVQAQSQQQFLHEGFASLGVNVEDPNEIRLLLLGMGILWQIEEVVTRGCTAQAHVLKHVEDAACRLVMALEEHAQRLGVRNAVQPTPEEGANA